MEKSKSKDWKRLYKARAFPVNGQLLRHYGPDTAVFLGMLIANIANHDGVFRQKMETLSENLHMSIPKIRRIKKRLIEDGIITTKLKGVPPKEQYEVNVEALEELLLALQ